MEDLKWDDLPDEIQDDIVFTCAVDGVEGSRKAMMIDRRFSQICKGQEYYRKVNFENVPRDQWKQPNSSEQDFMFECYFAGNPESFYRMLLVDIFEYGRYAKVESLLEKIVSGGHPQATYISCLVKLMGQTDEVRAVGFSEMVEIYKSDGGREKIDRWRFNLCYKLDNLHRGFFKFRLDVPRYCSQHWVPSYAERHNTDCNNCRADFETRVYVLRHRYRDVLNGDELT